MPVVEIHRLGKIYPDKKNKSVVALDDVSFTTDSGEVVGLLGVNGAGKTTALRIIATMLQPTSGEVTVGGFSVSTHPEQVRKQIGFMTSTTGLYPRLTPREILRYFGKLSGFEDAEIKVRIGEVVEEFDLSDFIDRKCDKLSTGQKQRINVARTSLHHPKLLVLDEPTAGLDVLGARIIVDFVRKSSRNGQSVLFSTHRMEEAEALCDRIVVIHRGRVVANGTIHDLRTKTGKTGLQDLFLSIIGE